MACFITEKEIEDVLLATETRMLPMPDGTFRPYKGFHMMWNSLDYLIGNYKLELEWFVGLAIRHASESEQDFDTAFRNIVAFVRMKFD